MNELKTLIFDMDGTLIDTEKYYRIMWPKALEHFGYHMTDEESLSLRSLGRPFIIEHMKNLYGEDFDYITIRDYRKKLMEDILTKNGIECKKGARSLLQYLKEHGYQTAVATASDLERTVRYLKQIDLLEYFDELISATMVKNGKPAPDIYLHACKQLGKKPEECIAVEDSPNGVMSAYTAGCKVIMVPDQTEPDTELSKLLYRTVSSLDQLITIL